MSLELVQPRQEELATFMAFAVDHFARSERGWCQPTEPASPKEHSTTNRGSPVPHQHSYRPEPTSGLMGYLRSTQFMMPQITKPSIIAIGTKAKAISGRGKLIKQIAIR